MGGVYTGGSRGYAVAGTGIAGENLQDKLNDLGYPTELPSDEELLG